MLQCGHGVGSAGASTGDAAVCSAAQHAPNPALGETGCTERGPAVTGHAQNVFIIATRAIRSRLALFRVSDMETLL